MLQSQLSIRPRDDEFCPWIRLEGVEALPHIPLYIIMLPRSPCAPTPLKIVGLPIGTQLCWMHIKILFCIKYANQLKRNIRD